MSSEGYSGSLAQTAIARGSARRAEVLGPEISDGGTTLVDPIAEHWRQFALEVPWGSIWTRPGLDTRTRAVCTVTVLATLGAETQLRTHFKGALRAGMSPGELSELMVHISAYAGMPKGATGIRCLQEAMANMEQR